MGRPGSTAQGASLTLGATFCYPGVAIFTKEKPLRTECKAAQGVSMLNVNVERQF